MKTTMYISWGHSLPLHECTGTSYLCSWLHFLQTHCCIHTQSYQSHQYRWHSHGSCPCPVHTHQHLHVEMVSSGYLTCYPAMVNHKNNNAGNSLPLQECSCLWNFLLVQLTPFPSNPLLHVHTKLPITSVQVAFTWQLSMLRSHSSMSACRDGFHLVIAVHAIQQIVYSYTNIDANVRRGHSLHLLKV